MSLKQTPPLSIQQMLRYLSMLPFISLWWLHYGAVQGDERSQASLSGDHERLHKVSKLFPESEREHGAEAHRPAANCEGITCSTSAIAELAHMLPERGGLKRSVAGRKQDRTGRAEVSPRTGFPPAQPTQRECLGP